MAGIFANVDSDIKKLQHLRGEIENIKKALKGINVKVDIDIAQGLESQLKSLTTQYDALVQKVSEAQGKILSSVNQINNASERIVKAQERLAQASGDRNAQGGVNKSNNAATQAETASVEAQAKAYEELKGQINGILGTREANIKRMLEEQNAIRLINEEIKKLEKLQGTSSSSSIQNRITQLNDSLLTHKAALSEVRQTLSNNAKLDNAAATSMNALSQSLSRMRIAYRDLTEEERNSPFGQQLLASIRQADAQIKELDASIGNHQRNVGNYASGWNGLSMSIQQIGRELPSLAMGWNTFFLAISNNLPILADEIKRARVEYDNMKKSGQAATPVWKQIVSSLLSWQTALTVGITLLTLYGEELIDWVSGLFGADKAQKSLTDSLTDFNSILGKSQAEANILFETVKRTTEGTEGRANAIREINKAYGEYLPNLLSESASLKELSDAYDIVNGKLRKNAALKAQTNAVNKVMDEAIKVQANALTEMMQISEKSVGTNSSNQIIEIVRRLTDDFRSAGASIDKTWQGVSAKIQSTFGAKALPGDFYEALNDYVKSVFDSSKEIENIQKRYNPFFNKEEADKAIVKNKEYWEEVKRQAESVIAEIEPEDLLKLKDGNTSGIEKDIVDAYTNAMSNIQKAEKALAAYDFNKKGGKKTKTNKDLFITVPDEEITLITPEEVEKEIALHREAMDRYLADYGDYQQKRLAIANMYALKISQAETEGEKLSLQKQSEEALKELDFEEFKNSINFADIFGNLDEHTTKGLSVLRDKLKTYINEAAKNLRPEDLKELQDAFKDLEFKIADRNPFSEFKSGLGEYKGAQKEVEQAQAQLNEVISKGTLEVSEYDKETGQLVTRLIDQKQAEDNLTKALSKRQAALAKLTKAANSFGEKGAEIVNSGNEILDMFDSFGVKIPESLSAAMNGLGQVMNGLESIDLTKPFSAITGTISVLTGIGKTIGGLFGLGGADYSGYEEMKSRYDNLISVWDTLISKKMEYIDIDYGVEAQKAADEAAKLVETQIQRQRQLANMLAGSGASTGSHSLGYRINDRMTQNDWTNLSDLVGQRVSGINDVLSLDADVIGKVLQDEKFVSVLTTVNSDFIEYIQNIEKYGEQLEEIAEKEKEVFTGISLDSFKDGFVDMLSDLDAKNEDFAENFEGYLQKAIFSSLVANQYKGRIEELYNQWASYGESGNKLTSDEADWLRNEYQDIVNDMLEQREQIMKDFGWDSSSSSSEQTASSRGFGTEMTHEDAGELSGRFTALQMSGETIASLNQQQLDVLNNMYAAMTGLNTGTNSQDVVKESYQKQSPVVQSIDIKPLSDKVNELCDIADEIRTRQVEGNMDRQNITDNVVAIVKPIQQMRSDISEVKQNTSRL